MVDEARTPYVPSKEEVNRAKRWSAAKIADLRNGRLPQMVDWIDPLVLGMVFIRDIISTTIGQYADQRPVQAAMDQEADKKALALRHDFSKVDAERHIALRPTLEAQGETNQRLQLRQQVDLDKDDGLWVDFIADLGDGFEATYAMAYLMASSNLKVEGVDPSVGPLPAGGILILGGDLAYPNATIKEYQNRCLTPYNNVFQGGEDDEKERKLFFVAGNHDWYDGLVAFTNVFCSARRSDGRGLILGGWFSDQRRSYFALRLPHNWWIWGIDGGLSDNVDETQMDYFAAAADQLQNYDKVILITHTPAWIDKNDKSLADIVKLVRDNAEQHNKKGVEIPAVLAGDLHNYSRYVSLAKDRPLVNLITSGGGGAFLHPTHALENVVDVSFTEPRRRANEGPPSEIEGQPFRAEVFYPSKGRSRMLAFKNLWLPFHNRRFAVFLGVIYMIFAWVFQIAAYPDNATQRSDKVGAEQGCVFIYPRVMPTEAEGGVTQRAKCIKEMTDILDKQAQATATALEFKKKMSAMEQLPAATWFAEAKGRGFLNWTKDLIWPSIAPSQVLFAMLANAAFFFMVVGLYLGLIMWVDVKIRSRWLKWLHWPIKIMLGVAHALGHLTLLLIINAVFHPIYALTAGDSFWWTLGGVTVYSLLVILIGGTLGGILFGSYWVITSVIGNIDVNQAFGALGIKDYKNFLRMHFDKSGGLTIYAIGLDKVPGREGWRKIDPRKDVARYNDHNPLIMLRKVLNPRLIDKIVGQPVEGGWKWNRSA